MGGLNMINIEHFIMALKITWIRRLVKPQNSPIKILFESTITPIEKLFTKGYQHIESKIGNISNKFWQDTLSSWVYMCKRIQPKNYIELYTLPIWHNPLLSNFPLFFPELNNNGINLIGDLLTDTGDIITNEELLIKTKLISINPLHYLSLKSAIQSILNKNNFKAHIVQKPIPPITYSLITKSNKGSKDFYKLLQTGQAVRTLNKWEHIFDQSLSVPFWKLIHRSCFKTVNDNYLTYLQFKIINNILGTKSLLYKMNITNNQLCSFCGDHEETIPHLFYECSLVYLLWQTLYNWISNKCNIRIITDKKSIILGFT